MSRSISLVIILGSLLLISPTHANDSILSSTENFSSDIPAPQEALGWPVGEWHARPEQITRYFEQLAAISPQAKLEVIGHTHEARPLLNLVISSEANQSKLESLRQQHLEGNGPLVIALGYSIHGNESSGSNAAMLVAYHLLASDSAWVKELLSDTIIILDPMLNPDGLSRFATWANMHRGQVPVSDRMHREHNEGWPSGRFNHYWFDMNRDWLPLTQPESTARVAQFQKWQPHIFGDFHEQDTDRGYFFQPGEPRRTHPLTPAENQQLTTELARFHAQALDQIGVRYFTRERFDDFYYGKGSTYPDIQGTIGILYEQASARGHLTESINGVFSFADAVKNHYATSISTLRGGHALKDELKQYHSQFRAGAADRAKRSGTGAWVFSDHGESGRALKLARVLQQHRIEVQVLDEKLNAGGKQFEAGSSFVVRSNQVQSGLVEAIFEQRTEFEDNAFYDVSAWTLPLAYNLKSASLKSVPGTTGFSDTEAVVPAISGDALAWRFSGDSLEAGALAIALANDDLPVYRVVSAAEKLGSGSSVSTGDFVLMRLHNQDTDLMLEKFQQHLQQWPVDIEAISSGLNLAGVDLGSVDVKPLSKIKPLLLTGKGLNPMETGHIWHLLDRRLQLPLPMLDIAYDLPDLDAYTHILIADGMYSSVPKEWLDDLEDWIRGGGVLITQKRSAEWAGAAFAQEPQQADSKDEDESSKDARDRRLKALTSNDDTSRSAMGDRPYASYDHEDADRQLGGAIFAANVDLTHPLVTGVYVQQMPVLLNRLVRLQPSTNAFSTPMKMGPEVKPMAGFASEWMREQLADQPILIAERVGEGTLVRFAFNANYRAFWRGTEQLYINALINSSMLQKTDLPE